MFHAVASVPGWIAFACAYSKFGTSLPSSSLLITSQLVSIGWDSSTLLMRQTHIACDEAQAREVATTQLRDVRFLTSSANVSTFTLPVHALVLSRHAPVDVSHVPANHNTQDRHTRGSQRLKHGSGTCHVYVAVGFRRETDVNTNYPDNALHPALTRASSLRH